jgi:ligand-binding sensor domain-containing protein
MHALPKNLLIISALVSIIMFLPAQARVLTNMNFEQLSAQDGFSQINIVQTVEDSYGFIWMVSNDGLSKYDGFSNRVYEADALDEGSIPSNRISGVVLDRQGKLWVATDNGLAIYNVANDSFDIINDQNSILKNSKIDAIDSASGEEIYIAVNDTIYLINAMDKTLQQVTSQTPFPSFISYIKDEGDRIWISSVYSGVFIFDKISGQLFDLSKQNPWNFILPRIEINKIEMVANEYWIATNKGLISLDSSTNIQQVTTTSNNPELPSNTINDIHFDGKNLWIATNRGLAISNPDTGIRTLFNNSNAISSGLQDSDIRSMSSSKNGTIWLGTASAGLHKFHPASRPLKLFKPIEGDTSSLSGRQVIDFDKDTDGNIWAATTLNGLNKFNQEQDFFAQYPIETEALLHDIVIDNRDKIWLATNDGIHIYRINDDQLSFENQMHAGIAFEKLSIFDDKIWAWQDGKGL